MSTEGSTCPWIASDRVEGTAVYGPDKERMGSIKRLMIDNTTGYVAYADLNFGGFLGIGGVRVSEAEKATLNEISSALKLAA